MFYPYVAEVGLPYGFVLQDGATSATIPWHQCQALFLGGSTEYKLSEEAHELCREAKRRGKWVHVGRVNSARRERLIAPFADSFDGTKYSQFARRHLPSCLNRLAGSGPQIPQLAAPPAPGRSIRRASTTRWYQDQMDLTTSSGTPNWPTSRARQPTERGDGFKQCSSAGQPLGAPSPGGRAVRGWWRDRIPTGISLDNEKSHFDSSDPTAPRQAQRRRRWFPPSATDLCKHCVTAVKTDTCDFLWTPPAGGMNGRFFSRWQV